MKRLLFFLMATLFAMQGFSQATLNEGFEGTTFPPDDWAKVTTQGTEAWERYTSSSPRGLACASVNYDDPSHINYLITPKLIVSSDQDSIVYWVKTSYDFGGTTLNVLVSTTDNAVTSFSTTSLQTVSTLSESWVRKSIPLTNYIGEEIYIAFQVVDFYGSRVMLDDVTGPELFVPTCPRPRALTVSNPTTTGIDLGWTDDTGLIWNIEYMLATETDWTNATTLYSVMNPHTFTSLNASTSYKARVQTDCGIEQSDWTSPITFMTACDPITVLPYSDSFDTYGTVTGSFPPCWSRPVLNTTTPFPSIHTTNNSAPASIKFQSASATAPTYVITPQFADDINLLRVKFFLKREGASSGTMEVGVMSDPNDLTSFELVATVDPSLNDWIEYEFLFSGTDITGPNNYIAFRHITNASNWYYWLDDVIVDYIPSCSKPGSIDAENITTTSADITWVPANQTDYAWWLYYKESSANDFDSVYVSGMPTYSFTTLNPSTGYEVYLKTDCSSELSEETSIFSFRTECGEITSFPWMENFDSYGAAGAFPPCWHRPVIYSTYPKTSTTASRVHSAPASLEIHSAVGAPTYAITPELGEDINLLKVNFWAMAESTSSSGTIEVGVMSDPTDLTTFESVQIIQPTNTAYNEYDIDFSQTTLSGIGNYIAFRQNTVSAIYYYWIDDVVVDYIPSCPRPDSVFSTSITQTYADIDIVPGDIGDTQWKIYHREVGTSTWTEDDVFAFPYQITGLTSNTPYEVFVKTLCSDATYSDGSTILNFHTPCENIITLPYTENFDTYGTGTAATSYPTCWSRNVSNYSTINYPYISTTNFSPPGAMYFYSYNNTRVVAVCNPIDISIPINTLTVEFKMYFSTVDAAGIQVGVMDDPNDFTTFVPVGSPQVISATSVWEDKGVILNDYAGTGQYIALAAIAPASEYARAYVDDFKIDYTPDCPDVYGLSVGAASTTSVSVNWDNSFDDGTGFNVAYASNVVGTFDPATSMIIPIPSGTTLPYTIPGFNPGDSIWVAVQRGCLGNWSEAQKINLPEFANQLPLIANFENSLEDEIWTITNGTQTNKWYIGVPGANDSDPTDGIDERGLYISSDLGATVTYDMNSSSVVFLSTLVEFDNSPSFQLSFDWSNVGEGSWDGINVYLLPIGQALTPGTLPNAQYKLNPDYLTSQSSFQTYTQALSAAYSNTVKQLVFCWRNDGSYGDNPPAKVDNISLVALACGMPYGLAMDSASYNGTDVYLSWTEPQAATDWIVEYLQTGTSTWNQVAANSNPFTLTGLNPGTAYQARVRTICDGSDTSSASNLISFLTECITMTVPTPVEPFFAVPPSICWSKMSGLLPATGNATLSTTTSGWLLNSNVTPNNAKINLYGTSCKYWLVSPSIDLGDGSTASQIEFDLFYTDYGNVDVPDLSGTDDRFAVVVSLDNGTTWNATNATIWSNAVGATKVLNNIPNIPTHIIIPLFDSVTSLPLSGIVKIGFYGESTATNADNDMHIDNFEVRPYSTCQRPTGLIATNVTSTDATIHFTENGTSTTWQYVLTDGTITDPNNGTPVSTTDNPIQLTGLTPQTEYTIWIRSDCTTETSIWSTPLTFVTEAPPATVPYSFDFENQTEALAWRNLSGSVNNWAIGQAAGNGPSTQNTTDNTAAYISYDNGTTWGYQGTSIYAYYYRDIDFGPTPTSYLVTYDWKVGGYIEGSSVYSGLLVYLRDINEPINPSGFPTDINNYIGLNHSGPTWQHGERQMDTVSGVQRLIFMYFGQSSNNPPAAAIDNISVIVDPCPRPISVEVPPVTLMTTTAEVTWVHPGADSYIISYRPDVTGSTPTDVIATTSPATITGLTAATNYVLTVTSICGTDTSIVSRTLSFATPCVDGAISSFPWTEGFESGLSCWTQDYTVGTIDWTNEDNYYSSSTPAHGGQKLAYFFDDSYSGNTTKLVSPLLDISGLATPYVSFWHLQKVWLSDQDELKVFYRASSDSSWTQLVHYSSNISSWQLDSVALPSASSTYQIAFEGIQNYGYGVALDDITVYDANSTPCPPPTNITVTPSNISANVTWTAGGGEASWEVRLGTTGTPEVTSITNHPLTGLTPSTTYTVYVRANCGTGYSSWIPKQFTTTSQPTPPTVTTAAPSTLITQTTAVLNGTYVEVSDPILTTGFEYKTVAETTWTDQLLVDATTPFTYTATGLTSNTDYEAKAYVTTTAFGKTYGNTINFTTLAIIPPTVTTDSVRNITQTSATFYGKITANTEAIEARGFEYKLSTEGWDDAINISATGVTEITAYPSTLQAGLTYNVRAYGRTLTATTYGLELIFNTPTDGYTEPIVITNDAIPTSGTEATLSGEITAGSEAITNQGFEWKATSEETWIPITVNGTTITYTLTGLTEGISYDYKAFATTAIETTYGNIKTFTPLGLYDIDGNEISIMMYPNPATHQTNLVISGVSGETKIILSDVQGRVLKTIDAKPVSGTLEQTIDLNNLAKGVYYIRIQNTDINRTQKLIVK